MAFTTIPAAGAKLRGSILSDLITEARPFGAMKTANETVSNSTTLQDDDELFVSVAANTSYALSGFVMFTSTTTADFKFGLDGPTSYTHRTTWETYDMSLVSGVNSADTRMFVEGGSLAIPGKGTTFSTQGQWVNLSGVVITSSTAGTLTVQWSQNGLEVSNTIVYAGSWIELRQLV